MEASDTHLGNLPSTSFESRPVINDALFASSGVLNASGEDDDKMASRGVLNSFTGGCLASQPSISDRKRARLEVVTRADAIVY